MKSMGKYIREALWPIYGIEHKKFLPLAFMMFCILFNYSLLRSVKDGFIVTSIGSEALGFLKTFFVLPSAVLATIITVCCATIWTAEEYFTLLQVFLN